MTPPEPVRPPRVVDLAATLRQFSAQWSPQVIARLDDHEVKLAKVEGEFVWHRHDECDELFLVLDGTLVIQLHNGNVTVGPGQLFVVPRSVEHCPVTAHGEVSLLLIDKEGVINTGSAPVSDLTAAYDDHLLE